MAFLLDSIKKIGRDEEDSERFDDMHYIVGNTSGLDIGQVPSPLDQRIGRMAQIGGSLMEVQITNPATFQIDRPEVMNVVNKLGLDMTLHGDPNIGFTAAYATRGQGITGYNIVHRYFKRYLEQVASFKWEKKYREENSGEGEFDFNIGYINMHASNEMIPPREERLASDISVDPFGFQITQINGRKDINIYKNENFLRKMYDYFFLEMVEQPWRQYEQIFSDIDPDFADEWNKVKAEEADQHYRGNKRIQPDLESKTGLIQTASSIDQGVDTEFLERLSEIKLENPFTVQTEIDPSDFTDELPDDAEPIPVQASFSNLEDVANNLQTERATSFLNTPRNLSRDLYDIEKLNLILRMENPFGREPLPIPIEEVVDQFDFQTIENAIEKLLDSLWGISDDFEGVITAEGKLTALSRNEDIQQSQILEQAQRDERIQGNLDKGIQGEARKAFADPENSQILRNLTQGRISDDFNKESSIFFNIMPAWMQHADENHDDDQHPGWNAPKFIWEEIVGEEEFETWREFESFLEESRENQLNVIAAVGALYMWGHFTQKEDEFERQVFESDVYDDMEVPELKNGENGKYTWIEWMNEFDIRVNIEAMYGSPGELRRVWRPKDIAVACRAINMTAENEMGEEYDESRVKFTIDMEHTASYGVDPVQELKDLVEQEKGLVGKIDSIDKDRPLADIVKTYHLTKPGWEQQQGHRHGPFARGDTTLYRWLHYLVDNGFARNPDDQAIVMFEVGGEYREEMYVIRVAMDMIELGIEPEDLDPNAVDPGGEYDSREEALIARFFGMDKGSYNREWAKIEEHAFDPLDGLLEARGFDETFSSQGAIEQGQARPNEWKNEEFK